MSKRRRKKRGSRRGSKLKPGEEFTEIQPRDGDIVLICKHGRDHARHFWSLPDDVEVERPDGSVVNPQWIVACESCFLLHCGDPLGIPITGDAVWKGDEPEIKRTVN